LSVELIVNGTVEVDIDCVSLEACVVTNEHPCLGSPGTCFAAEIGDAGGFAYRQPGCLNGGLSCSSR
jgi:hypothetical protein